MSETGVDVAAYLHRIGYDGPTDPTADTLAALVIGHTMHIPFENLDPLCGVPVIDLGPAALTAKLVTAGRGGYCYEHNTLLRYVLAELGFGVDALGARVVWGNPEGPDGPPPAETHQALAVRLPGDDGGEDPWLVDVGFGGQTLTSPIRLRPDAAQQTRHEDYRLRRRGGGYLLETRLPAGWTPLYTFSTVPRPLIDLQVGSWYVSTYPESKFVTGLSAAITTADARWNLRGRHLTVHLRDGHTERTRLDSAEQVLDVLADRFGLPVYGIDGLAARVAEVLDS
ncbi:arylamine N-acetyltransferase [Mycobacterium sp. 1274756.6]|uniref:arylamine N-acetyltransferase family protein n=1 Tax=Mycobacterium sp. 1274756.6 TaxID=1834076 RepID=UPI00080250E4|nr:arylamine N-acetyltransferase [Mycobacterium sp. 1274756.6]OBJ72172.1 arylamine N-acetyltransferase [Mycobacterium sp. 1274756.6]